MRSLCNDTNTTAEDTEMSRIYVVTFIHAFDAQQNVYEVCTAPGLAERRLAEIANLHTRRNRVKNAFRDERYEHAIDSFTDECKADNSHQLYVSECDPKPGQTTVVREPNIPNPLIQDSGEPNCVLAAEIKRAVAQVFKTATNGHGLTVTSSEIALIHAYAASQLARHAEHTALQVRQARFQREQR